MDGLNSTIADSGVGAHRFTSRRLMPPPPSRWQRLRTWLPFAVFVLVPTAAATGYMFAFAADQYVSEARFVVRSETGTPPGGALSSLLQGIGVSRAQDDTFAVQDYILSRDGLQELNQSIDVRKVYDRPEADVLSRFPGPFFGTTFEHLYKYYLNRVDINYDTTTGVTELTVRAYRPDDAASIARALLVGGEHLVNRMNERQRLNTMQDAKREVTEAEARVEKVAADLADYRNHAALLDPNKQSVAMLQAIYDMQTHITASRTQLGELQKSSPQSPMVGALKQRISVLQSQIDDARTHVTGVGDSMVPAITQFDALTLQREFADRELSSAMSFFDTARLNAERQDLYLEEIVKPNMADYPLFPKRLVDIAIVFATCFGVFTIAKLLIAGAREHRTV